MKSKPLLITYSVLNLLPVFVFVAFVVIFSQNLLILDDYEGVAQSFLDTVNADSFFEKIKSGFVQKNEYRLPFNWVVSMFQYTLFNKLYFNVYPLVGNLSIFVLGFVLYKLYYNGENKYRFFAISFLLFPLHVYLIVTWAIASMQYICAIVYGVITIYFLLKPKMTSLYVAMFFAVLAVFSFGSGIYCLPVGLLALLYKKDVKKIVSWAVFSAVLLLIYFWEYKGAVVGGNQLQLFLENPVYVIKGFLYLMGGWAEVLPSKHPLWDIYFVLFAGIITIGLVVMLSVKILRKFINKTPLSIGEEFSFFSMILIIGVVFLIALGRSGTEPEIIPRMSSHKYNSFLLLIIIYLNYFKGLSKNSFWILYGVMITLYIAGVSNYLDKASNRAKVVAADNFNHYTRSGTINQYSEYFYGVDKELSERGVYSFPEIDLHKSWLSFSLNGKTSSQSDLSINQSENYVSFEKNKNAGSLFTCGEYVLLKSDSRVFVIPFFRNESRSLSPFKRSQNISATLDLKNIKSGEYEVFLMKKEKGKETFLSTKRLITVN